MIFFSRRYVIIFKIYKWCGDTKKFGIPAVGNGPGKLCVIIYFQWFSETVCNDFSNRSTGTDDYKPEFLSNVKRLQCNMSCKLLGYNLTNEQ